MKKQAYLYLLASLALIISATTHIRAERSLDTTSSANDKTLKSGSFFLSCNYWASHAGTAMWSDWNPKVVEEDFRKLSEAGITVLRIFPTWSDFQPISAARHASGRIIDYRFGERHLPDDAYGRAGVSETMVERMRTVLDLGEKYNIKFIVALVTGHMSGRVFTPPAIDGTNPLTDPHAIRWEMRMVQCLVGEFRDHKAVIGWGLGNEANCMGATTRDQAYLWTASISNAIRSIDPVRPVLSDMHGLEPEGNWSILDQGELTDILTTHPYPLYTDHCGREPINTIRPILHGVAESKFYGGLSGRPVLIEEMGSLGPMVASEEVCADFFRTATFASWANDCFSTMWWCNSDFSGFQAAPYDWLPLESELGLFGSDGRPKPIVEEMRKFSEFRKRFPYAELPQAKTDAVCILTKGQDAWGVAQSAFILGMQAGMNIGFQYATQPLKESNIYLLPCVGGLNAISVTRFAELLERVSNGATLYISMGDCYLPDFKQTMGMSVETRAGTGRKVDFSFDGSDLTIGTDVSYIFSNQGAEILAQDKEGGPIFTRHSYGKGVVYLLTVPMESELAASAGCFDRGDAMPFWKLYASFGDPAIRERIVSGISPLVGVTEHYIDKNKCVAVIINYSPRETEEKIALKKGWRVKETHYGERKVSGGGEATIGANDALVVELVK